MAIGSQRHARLIASVAEHICTVGRLPLLGTINTTPSTVDAGRANSAHRVRALHRSLVVPPELAGKLNGLHGPVLLIDDFLHSGWTIAGAARELRLAPPVLPLVLATTS